MPPIPGTRYRHTNLIARDWKRLAAFYERVFGCTVVPPERDQAGDWLSRGTGVPNASLRGVHLRLPGCGPDGPTLELFQYGEVISQPESVANRAGYGHLGFAVDDVTSAVERVVAEGGRRVGDVITQEIRGAGTVCFAYVRDPEGNILELQSWHDTLSR